MKATHHYNAEIPQNPPEDPEDTLGDDERHPDVPPEPPDAAENAEEGEGLE